MRHPLLRTTYSIFGILFLAFLFMSYSGNAPNGYTGAPGESTCAGCHSGNSLGMTGDIQIQGVPSMITPNTTYPLSVVISNPDGISLSAGFSMLVLGSSNPTGPSAGVLSNPSAGAAVASGFKEYFEHSPAQPYDINRMATWTVDWTSPASTANEVITFYGIGNITDNNPGSNTSSDFVVSTSVSGTIAGTPLGADLTLSNLVGWNASYSPGEVVFFDFDINNIGNADVIGDYNIMSYLSTDAVFDPSDISVGDLVTGFTQQGSIPSVQGAISIPANLTPGNYYLIIVIDAGSVISELDETNNILVSPIAAPIQPSVPLISSWNVINASCNGGNDGAATATPTGGTTPYIYAWQNGMTTQTITGLAAGSYPFTVTDASGNSVNDIAIVNEPSQLVATVSTTDVQCATDTDGTANATVNGGTLPYNISWPGGSSTNLAAGNYIVTITDNNGCSTMENYTIVADDTTPPQPVVLTLLNVSIDSAGQYVIDDPALLDVGSTDNCGGLLTFSIVPNVFDCSDIGLQEVITTVTDDSGNMDTALAQINIQDNIAPTIICPTIFTPNCGGVVEYSLPIVDDNCTQNITPVLVSGLPSGSQFPVGTSTVIYEATDNESNVSSCSFMVTIPDNTIVSELSSTNVSCFGLADGTAAVTTSGGTPPYQFNWSNDENTPTITNLIAGTYMVTVQDSNGCEMISSVEVEAPTPISIAIDLVQDDTGSNNGSIFITASGGAGGFTYIWQDENGVVVSTSEDPQTLTAGTYTVSVTDISGCVGSSVQILVNTVVGIEEISLENAIHVFPNPTAGQLNINVDENLAKSVALQIFDQSGKLVYNNNQIDLSNQVVDIAVLQNGLYWCKFIVEENVVVRKVVLVK